VRIRIIAAESARDEGVLSGVVVARSACGASAGAPDTVGEIEPGFGNDEQAYLVVKHRRTFGQIEAGGGPAPVLGF